MGSSTKFGKRHHCHAHVVKPKREWITLYFTASCTNKSEKSGTSETLSLKRWKTMLVALIQQTGLLFIHYHHQLARFVLNVLFLVGAF